jgi:hypothetical protein
MGIEEEKKEFLKLLDEAHDEQTYQAFLEEHTRHASLYRTMG